MLLLAAHHDAVEDESAPGLIRLGRELVSPCFTYEGLTDERHLALEHIAPVTKASGWVEEFYSSKEVVHRIGNLVLVPSDANSSLGNRPWAMKQLMYAALGARSREGAERILSSGSEQGLEVGEGTQQLVQLSHYQPHLAAVGRRQGEWTVDFAQQRAERILGLAWDRLYAWLQ